MDFLFKTRTESHFLTPSFKHRSVSACPVNIHFYMKSDSGGWGKEIVGPALQQEKKSTLHGSGKRSPPCTAAGQLLLFCKQLNLCRLPALDPCSSHLWARTVCGMLQCPALQNPLWATFIRAFFHREVTMCQNIIWMKFDIFIHLLFMGWTYS